MAAVGVISPPPQPPPPPPPETLPPPPPVVAIVVRDIEAGHTGTMYFMFMCRLDMLLGFCVWT
jgi:hypothetical protein